MNPAPGVCDQRVLKDLFSPAGRGLGLAGGRGRLCVTCVLITCRALINGSSFCLAPRTLLKTRCFISVCFPGTLIPVNNRVQTLSTWSSSKSRGASLQPWAASARTGHCCTPGDAGFPVLFSRGVGWRNSPPEAHQPQFPLFPT